MTQQAQLAQTITQALALAMFFAVVGPLAGLAGFLSVLLGASIIGFLTGVSSHAAQNFAMIMMLAVIGIPFAYFYGFLPSVAAGILIGLLRLRMMRVPWYLALLIGLCIGAVFTIAYRHDMILGYPGEYGRWADHLLNVFPCVAATMICWAIVRNWFVPPRVEQASSPNEAQSK
jgi:hypothetical protein